MTPTDALTLAWRALPFAVALPAAVLSVRRPAWRPVALQLAGLGVLSLPLTPEASAARVAVVAMWPGVALAGAVLALSSRGPAAEVSVKKVRGEEQVKCSGAPIATLLDRRSVCEPKSERAQVVHSRILPLAALAAYALLAALAALCYSPSWWWLGERLLLLARYAVGPALVVAWWARKDERPEREPEPLAPGVGIEPTPSRFHPRTLPERYSDVPPYLRSARRRATSYFRFSVPSELPRPDQPRFSLTPAQVAALAPAVESALAPLGPWARLAIGGIVAVREDWDLGLLGSAVAYAVVACAMVVEVRRGRDDRGS